MLVQQFPSFGGVMGWEFFNSLPGERAKPWQWAAQMSLSMGMKDVLTAAGQLMMGSTVQNMLRDMQGR
jgi:chitinase